jgi:hypothetical protein
MKKCRKGGRGRGRGKGGRGRGKGGGGMGDSEGKLNSPSPFTPHQRITQFFTGLYFCPPPIFRSFLVFFFPFLVLSFPLFSFPISFFCTFELSSFCTYMRPILWLASSKILTPHPLYLPASVSPPPLVRGEDTLAGWRGGWEGQYFGRRQTQLCTLRI